MAEQFCVTFSYKFVLYYMPMSKRATGEEREQNQKHTSLPTGVAHSSAGGRRGAARQPTRRAHSGELILCLCLCLSPSARLAGWLTRLGMARLLHLRVLAAAWVVAAAYTDAVNAQAVVGFTGDEEPGFDVSSFDVPPADSCADESGKCEGVESGSDAEDSSNSNSDSK